MPVKAFKRTAFEGDEFRSFIAYIDLIAMETRVSIEPKTWFHERVLRKYGLCASAGARVGPVLAAVD